MVPSGPTGWPRGMVPVLVVAAAACAKLVVLAQLNGHPLLQPHGDLDTAYYLDIAQRVARDGVLGVKEPFAVSPLYVYFLAAVFAAGGGALAAKVVQVALGTAAIALVYLTSRQWFGRPAAIAAAALAALTGLFTFYEVLILQAALDPFLVAATLFAITRAACGGAKRWAAAAGLFLGLLALNRPNSLAYVPAAAVALAVAGALARRERAVHRWRQTWLGLGALGLGLGAVLGLNALRNYAASGEAVMISSHGGLNFYIGNHAGADGAYSPVPGIRPSIAGQAEDSVRVAAAALGRPVSPGDASAYFYRQGWEWMTDRPADAAALFARKLVMTVNRTNVPLNFSYGYFASEAPSLGLLAGGPWILIPLGFVGLVWPSLRERRHGYWAWASFVPVYGLSVAVFFVSSRYRMPLLVPLCASSGALVVRCLQLMRHGGWRGLARPLAAALVITVLVNWNLGLYDGVDGQRTQMAVWLIEQGRYDEAQAYAEGIAAGHRHPGVLAYRMGSAYLAAGRNDDAVTSFRKAATLDGPRPAILLLLGRALLASGRAGEAVEPLLAAYRAGFEIPVAGPVLVRALVMAGRAGEAVRIAASMPDDAGGDGPEVPLDLGTLALEQGDQATAERWLRRAVAVAPDTAEAHEKLGVALFLQNRPADALPMLQTACRLAPASASSHLNLAAVLASLGRVDEARQHAAAAVRLDPAEPRAAALLRDLQR